MNQMDEQVSDSTGAGTAPLQPTTSFDLMEMDARIRRRANARQIAKLAGWAALVAVGLSRRGVLGWAGASAGVYGLIGEVLRVRAERPEWQKAALSGRGWLGRLVGAVPADPVDRSSAQSFPASDSPSYEAAR